MSKLVFLGDSFTNNDYMKENFGHWTNKLADDLGCEFLNFGVSNGNNNTQNKLLENYILSDDYSADDIFLWQSSYEKRSTLFLKKSQKLINILDQIQQKYDTKIYENIPTFFDNSDSEIVNIKKFPETLPIMTKYGLDFPQSIDKLELQEMLLIILLLSKLNHKVFLFLGWQDCISSDYVKQIKSKTNNNFKFIDVPIKEWCIENNLLMADDGEHPDFESTYAWSNKFLKPELEKIL